MNIKLVKLQEAENPKHPNNIEVGYEKIGKATDFPKVGECFYIAGEFGLWRTSVVQEILSFDKFRTLNSIYQIIPIE